MTALQIILALLILVIFYACCWLTHWDVTEECKHQARLDDLWADDSPASLEPRMEAVGRTERPMRESRPAENSNRAAAQDVGDAGVYDWVREAARDWTRRGREGRAG